MNALLRAMLLYEGHERTFAEDLAAFTHTGRVHITPTAVLFAKAVPSRIKEHGPWDIWEESECDAWLIWLGAGDMREFFRYAPYPLPWFVWARKDRLRWWRYEDVRRRVCGEESLAPGNVMP